MNHATNAAQANETQREAFNHALSRNADLIDLLTPITAADLELGDNGTLDTVIECPKIGWTETLNSEWADSLRSDDFNIDFDLALAEFQDELEERQREMLFELGLSFEPILFDFVTMETTFEFLFSWGGPSETLRFKVERGGTCADEITFIFKDWFTSFEIDVMDRLDQFEGLQLFADWLAQCADDLAQSKFEDLV